MSVSRNLKQLRDGGAVGKPAVAATATVLTTVRTGSDLRHDSSLQAIFAVMTEGLVIHGADGQVIEANPAAEAILGLGRAAILASRVDAPSWRLLGPDGGPLDRDRYPAAVGLHTGLPVQGQVVGVDHPQGGRRWLSVNATPVWGDDPARPEAVVTTFVDITERRRKDEELAALSAELQDLYDHAPCGYHSLDADGKFVRINATEQSWLGCTAEELIGRKGPTDFFTEEGRRQFARIYPGFLADGHVGHLEYDLVAKDGSLRKVSISATAVTDSQGRFLRSRGVVYDVTELQQSREQLRRRTLEQDAMLDNDIVGIVKLKQRRMSWRNRAMSRIFGYAQDELLGQPSRLLYPDDGSFEALGAAAYPVLRAGGTFRTQLEMLHKNGSRLWVDVSGVALPGTDDESIWFLADISELKRYQESFERMAHVDALTGLPNRVLLADRLEQALALARRHQYGTAVCYVDLDGFKAVNDSQGHAAGDVLLQEVARRMSRSIRTNDTAARLGGDEFVLLLTHVEQVGEIEHLLQRVLAEVALPVEGGNGIRMQVTASIGVALSPQDGWDARELLRRADTAMYAAKRMGKNTVHFYRDASTRGAASS